MNPQSLSECLRATQRKVAPRPSEKPLLKFLIFDCLCFDHWPLHLDERSEHKAPERSEVIVAFAFCGLCSCTAFAKTAPKQVGLSDLQ